MPSDDRHTPAPRGINAHSPAVLTPMPPGEGTQHSGEYGDAQPDASNNATAPRREASNAVGHNAPRVDRGLSEHIATASLREAIRLRTLTLLQRFRVIRTLDVALACFAERPFKAALTGAQRAMRGLSKAGLVRRYRTDRFQHVYGLTAKGVTWLDERGVDASSSVRRVSDMTNPEHRLWAQWFVLACEARGLRAQTESELLQELNRDRTKDAPPVQGLLALQVPKGQHSETRLLRPDALAFEGDDGCIWFEVDRSKRGADREASLRALARAVGVTMKNGHTLRRLVVLARTERIRKRALAVLQGLASGADEQVLVEGRVQLKHVESGDGCTDGCLADVFEVWTAVPKAAGKKRTALVDARVGHVIVQLLPTWLPKVRLDSRNRHPLSGWLGDNYLPYRRPATLPPWQRAKSPLTSSSTHEASA